ncbi:ribosome maturation factor RimP [Salsipaludibacter albus]|uniref:ribosome maturation factor RimP n=1 Tax=Salsipaludibacter albus TaxID=2849650 RepID=UPI001EE4B7DF|nr:hypothetical protein [Salsipaludibacter albus]MBY5162841.1 hypothetical protein [Salsipaludibacter albus]
MADDTTATADALRAAIAEVVADHDVELLEVEVKGPRNRRIVRLVADAPDGLDIETIAAISREAGPVADDLVDGSYTLEVSSPGVDRPLTTVGQFARNVGRDVEVRHARGDTDTQTTGTIADVDETTLVLDVGKEQVEIPFDEVFEGRIVLPW